MIIPNQTPYVLVGDSFVFRFLEFFNLVRTFAYLNISNVVMLMKKKRKRGVRTTRRIYHIGRVLCASREVQNNTNRMDYR